MTTDNPWTNEPETVHTPRKPVGELRPHWYPGFREEGFVFDENGEMFQKNADGTIKHIRTWDKPASVTEPTRQHTGGDSRRVVVADFPSLDLALKVIRSRFLSGIKRAYRQHQAFVGPMEQRRLKSRRAQALRQGKRY